MLEAITNISPLLYLHRIGTLNWLRELFGAIVVPSAVVRELQDGRERGYDVPDPADHAWLQMAAPAVVPSEWLALDLGPGELAVLALGLATGPRWAGSRSVASGEWGAKGDAAWRSRQRRSCDPGRAALRQAQRRTYAAGSEDVQDGDPSRDGGVGDEAPR